jgi:hypothetical protein
MSNPAFWTAIPQSDSDSSDDDEDWSLPPPDPVKEVEIRAFKSCRDVNLQFHSNRLQPVLTLRQGKQSTAVMPANFEANIIQIVPPSIVPPTHEQALQRLAAAEAVLKLAQEAKAAAFEKLAAAQRCNAAAAFDMSETAQADGGIVIKKIRFDFETCDEIWLFNSNVRLLSLHVVASRAMHPAPAVRILASRRSHAPHTARCNS